MTMKSLNVRVDDELKTKAEHIFEELGISTSTAVTMFLKSTVRCGGFPCDLNIKAVNEERIAAKGAFDMNKEKAWDFALGMIKVDGLVPSTEFLELVELEKKGEVTTEDIKKVLDQKYTMKGDMDHA